MKTGAVSAALAASTLLLAGTASADRYPAHVSPTLSVDLGHGAHLTLIHQGHRDYDRFDTRRLARDAVRQCRRAIRDEGYARGFREVDFDDRYVRQVGPRGFVVRFETEFEGRRREFERDVRCEVRRGRIVALDGVPTPGRRYSHRH